MTDTPGPKGKPLLVYFVTKGPIAHDTSEGNTCYLVEAQISADNGETVESMVFSFGIEEHASTFKRDVNNQMEPTILGDEKDE